MPNPSRIYLQKLDPAPATILDFLVTRFPGVAREVWIDRMARGIVSTASGRKLTEKSPYAHGLTITYFRESELEPHVPFEEQIVYRDERILVVDKPHFLPVVPGGAYVEECVLARVRKSTGLADLTPMHRLDRDTAGLVLFVAEPSLRRLYHALFADDEVEKEYHAVAHVSVMPDEREWQVESRIEQGDPWYRVQVVQGEPNASTRIVLDEWRDGRGYFRLFPRTGRKHQLRVQMASLGWPIVDDRLYPVVVEEPSDLLEHPMQLLASRLAFTDPVSGKRIEVVSERKLDW
jgi:tRNA pseudouridine32 synthase / 23S rRNA pseudouridine746 synthase